VVPLFAADLKIGVLSLFRPERITVRSSQMLWVQAGPRTFFLTPGQTAGLRAVGAEVDLFAQQQMSSSPRVSIAGRGGAPVDFSINIEGKIDRKFRGRLEVTAVGSRLEPVILIATESAVAAVVAAEMPANTPVEALKAMAVLARSYYASSGRRHGPYDFCDTTHCQWRRESIAESHAATAATRATEGIVITYRGRPFAPMYHAACGGETKRAADVGLDPDPYPYFPVACDPCNRDAAAWTKRLPVNVARPLLAGISESLRLTITRQLGWSALPGNNYRARLDGDQVIVDGRGEGHGVGVCQRGMSELAKSGETFRGLLAHYLPQTRTTDGDEP
jgi:stage II sporulation protein D